jgi:hypothetical protein
MDVETMAELKNEQPPTYWVTANDFKFISTEGTTFNGHLSTIATGMCLPQAKLLPNEMGPAEKATGLVLLDVPETQGTLVMSAYGQDAWEWELPSPGDKA